MRILLVEDNPILGDGIRSGLIQYQYDVDLVKDGLAGWTVVQNEHFDLVILDLNLPKLSGEEFLKNLRTNGMTIPVIILTSRDMVPDFVKDFGIGVDDYIVKPFDLEKLCARIRMIQNSCS